MLVITLPYFPSKAKNKPSLEQLSEASALVRSQTGSGSGFFMTNSLLVTSYHVIQKAYIVDEYKVVVIITQDGKADYGIVVATDTTNDLAIIKTLKKSYKAMPLGDYQNVKLGDKISLFGSPKGLIGTLTKGHVSAKRTLPDRQQILQINVTALPGSSGSPVLSEDLKVIGVLKGGPADTINFAVPITYIHKLIQENKPYLRQINALSYEEAIKKFGVLSLVNPDQEKLNKALLEATKDNDLEELKALLKKGADVNAQDKDGWTALLIAIFLGHQEIAKRLVLAKAKDAKNFCGTALILAIKEDYLEIAKLLAEKGADVQGKDGRTALMSAISGGHQEIAEILIQTGANVNAQDKDGWTALMEANLKNHQKVVKILVQAGAEMNVQNKDLSTLDQLRKRKGENFVGMIDKDAVRRVVRRNLNQLKMCYERLGQHKRSSAGKVELGWDIYSEGCVRNVRVISSEIKDQKMLNCMKSRLTLWRFPGPPEGVIGEVKFPFMFVLQRQ